MTFGFQVHTKRPDCRI